MMTDVYLVLRRFVGEKVLRDNMIIIVLQPLPSKRGIHKIVDSCKEHKKFFFVDTQDES